MTRLATAVFGIAFLAGAAWWSTASGAADLTVCATPRQMQGFKTCADVDKAEQEGEIVLYSTDPEGGGNKMMAAFNAMFPKIKTNYLRLQAGALYAKLLSERQAKSYLADVMQISDMGMALDFQKRNGYFGYISPEMAAYKPLYKSQPEGYWTWGSIIMAGIAYNPQVVPPDQAPKTWADVFDPKWTDAVNVKNINSGLQHETWYELRRLYGKDFWKKFADIKPRPFDSYVQQYDRLVNHQDKISHTAQYSGYIDFKARGAPVAFVAPTDGLPAGPQVYGVIADAPHPQAALLFMDWFLSVPGQKALGEALLAHSARDDVPPPGGALPLKDLKLLVPEDWQAFLATKTEFNREWNSLTGVR